jgi:anti-sigma factor RsiW
MKPVMPPRDASPEPIDCETAVRRLWDYLDGRLPSSARAEVEAHLAVCEYCPPHFVFAREMQATLAASAAPTITDAEETELRHRVRAALQRLAKE